MVFCGAYCRVCGVGVWRLILAFTAGSEGPLGPGESGSESPHPAGGAAGERVHLSHTVF